MTRYYVRLLPGDGAAAAATETLAAHGVPVGETIARGDGSVVLVTDTCREGDMAAALGAHAAAQVANAIRIENIAAWTEGVEAN